MSTDNSPESGSSSSSDETGFNLELVLLGYVDRMNRGGRVDPEEIYADHPDVAGEILEQLEAFQGIDCEFRPDPPLGTLGDYTLRRQIGRGGMGVVYEAWENSMDRAVALKVLPVGVAADDRSLHRFVREAKTAGKLNHPNVVSVYGMGLKEQTPYYAMELVEGETLAQVLARIKDAEGDTETPFGPKDQVDYFAKLSRAFADVADGLQHAHSKGVVHRDMKPSNLILDGAGKLRILDFGLARLEGQESLTLSGDFVGTPLYMSPEQARRKRIPVDHRTDVYSLGATMYEAICGRPPFRGKDHADTLSQIIERDPAEPRKVNARAPRDLETIVLKCLRKDSIHRYGTAEALAQDLRRFVRGDPIEARPEARWETVQRLVSRHRGKLVITGGILSLLLVCALLATLAYSLLDDAGRLRTREYQERVRDALMMTLRGRMILSRTEARKAGSVPVPAAYEPALEGAERTSRTVVEEAVRQLDAAIRSLPERPEGYYCKARALEVLRRETEALAVLEEGLSRDPQFLPAVILQDTLLGREEPPESKALPTADDWAVWWFRAHRAAKNNDWQEAERAYGELLYLERVDGELFLGSSLDTLLGRGRARLELGSYRAAAEDFVRAQENAGGFLEAGLLLGKTYLLDGRSHDAERKFQELYRRTESRHASLKEETALWIALVYKSFDEHRKGLEWTRELADGHLKLTLEADFFARSGRLGVAIARRQALTALRPADSAESVKLGWLLFQDLWVRHRWKTLCTGDYDPRDFLELNHLSTSAFERDPENSSARELRIQVLEAQGEMELAAQLRERALASARVSSGSGDVDATGGTNTRTNKRLSSEGVDMNGQRKRFAQGAAAMLLLSGTAHAQQGFFGPPKRIQDPEINSAFADAFPRISANGLTFHWASSRNGGDGHDLFMATRDSADEPFGNVQELEALNQPDVAARRPSFSADGKTIYFDSSALVGFGGSDLWMVRRSSLDAPFDGDPENLGPGVNTESREADPTISANGLELYFSGPDRAGGVSDLYVSRRSSTEEPFGEAQHLEELASSGNEYQTSISSDGFTLFFGRYFWQGNSGDIWIATRQSLDDNFSNPTNLGPPVSMTGTFDHAPSISFDWPAVGATLYFDRCITGTECDLYQATWHVDCNRNMIDDRDDVIDDESLDGNGNGIPDECEPTPIARFLRADSNADGTVNIADGVATLGFLFDGTGALPCLDAADTDDSGKIDIADSVATFNWLFAGGADPASPGPEDCGNDPTPDDELDCATFAPCPR